MMNWPINMEGHNQHGLFWHWTPAVTPSFDKVMISFAIGRNLTYSWIMSIHQGLSPVIIIDMKFELFHALRSMQTGMDYFLLHCQEAVQVLLTPISLVNLQFVHFMICTNWHFIMVSCTHATVLSVCFK